MEKYFYESLSRGIGSIIYNKYGAVKVAILGDKEDTFVRIIAYNAPSSVINSLNEEEKEKAIVFTKEYSLSDMRFSNETSVFKKLNHIISDIEITLN